MNPAVTKYMREMQARSAASRWGGLSPAERSAKMKALRAKAKLKPKRAARLPNLAGGIDRQTAGWVDLIKKGK